jgi:excisionase family DNA binding protein
MVKNEETVLEFLQRQDEKLKSIENLLALSKSVLNIDEVSKLTGLSKSTIYKCTHKGIVPHYKQQKHLYFDRLEIESWLKENRGFNVDEIQADAANSLNIRLTGQKGGN